MEYGILCVLPVITILVIAVTTKRTLFAMTCGLSMAALKAVISSSVRRGRSLNKMMKKVIAETGKVLLIAAALNLPFWLYIAGVL